MIKPLDSPSFPFSLYDFFGYFLPGVFFVLLIPVEYDAGDLMDFYRINGNTFENFSSKFSKELKFQMLNRMLSGGDGAARLVPILIAIPLFYLIGHVISAVSSYLLERQIVGELLGLPSVNLLKQKDDRCKVTKKFFGKFTDAFDPVFLRKMRKTLRKRFGKKVEDTNYFWLCFAEVSRINQTAYRRVMHFVNLYGFSRNIAMCFFLYVFLRVFLMWMILDSALNAYNWVILIAMGMAGYLMFINYLKLFNRQCKELYYHFYALQKGKSSFEEAQPE